MRTTLVKSENLCVGDILYIDGAGPVEIVSINKITRTAYEIILVSDTTDNKYYHRENGGSLRWCRQGKELKKVISH